MKLIPNWAEAWKFWSVQLNLIGNALLGWFILVPDAALWAWNVLPADIKKAFPPEHMPLLCMVLFGLSIFARVIKQRNIDDAQ